MPSVNPVVEPEVIDPVCGMSILPSAAVGQVTTLETTTPECVDAGYSIPPLCWQLIHANR